MYPFAFELELHYSVSEVGLVCRLTVSNTGNEPMPYYAGFHPYFATPPVGAGKAQTRFEAYPTSRLIYNATKTDVVDSLPPPTFPMTIVNDEISGLLLDVGDRGESNLIFPGGCRIRQTASALFRYRQCYTLPNEPFFCDEPWMAPAGSMNRAGAVHLLQPGQSETGTLSIAPASA